MEICSSYTEFRKTKKPNLHQVYLSAAQLSFPLKRPAAFRPLLTKGLALSGLSLIRFSFFGRPLKQNSNQMEILRSFFVGEILKVFLHLPPPLGKRKLCWWLQIKNTKSDYVVNRKMGLWKVSLKTGLGESYRYRLRQKLLICAWNLVLRNKNEQ